MYYAHPLISYPSSTTNLGLSKSPVSERKTKSRSDCNKILLTVMFSLYGALHLAVAVLALFLIQVKVLAAPHQHSSAHWTRYIVVFLFQFSGSERIIEEVELSVFGLVGFLASGLALAGVCFKYRHFLLPLLLFLLFTTVFDSISVFASFTTPEEEDNSNTSQYLKTARNYFPIFSSGLAVSLVLCKIFFSIFLIERVIHNYKKNIKIRGGRSPVRSPVLAWINSTLMTINKLYNLLNDIYCYYQELVEANLHQYMKNIC